MAMLWSFCPPRIFDEARALFGKITGVFIRGRQEFKAKSGVQAASRLFRAQRHACKAGALTS
jgi:hypothetical protein